MPVEKKESYQGTLNKKQEKLQEQLAPFCKLEPIIGMEKPENYRMSVNKMFYYEKNNTRTNEKSDVKEGQTEDLKALEIIQTIQGMLKSFKIKMYDKRTGYGLLRCVAVRKGKESEEIMVTLVLTSTQMPSKNNFIKELRKAHPEISTVLINENYKNTDSIFGDREVTVFGKGFLLDTMKGKSFRVGMKSQYPVNPVQSQKIYETIVSWCEFKGTELVLDAYCGMGMNGIMISDHVKKVISVDTNPQDTRDAISCIRRNKIKNVDVYVNDPAEFLRQVTESEKKPMDVILVSAPYGGCNKAFMETLFEAKPKKLVYISRNPISLATDLEWLGKNGYKVRKAVGVDLLPFTERVETVVLLTRS